MHNKSRSLESRPPTVGVMFCLRDKRNQKGSQGSHVPFCVACEIYRVASYGLRRGVRLKVRLSVQPWLLGGWSPSGSDNEGWSPVVTPPSAPWGVCRRSHLCLRHHQTTSYLHTDRPISRQKLLHSDLSVSLPCQNTRDFHAHSENHCAPDTNTNLPRQVRLGEG